MRHLRDDRCGGAGFAALAPVGAMAAFEPISAAVGTPVRWLHLTLHRSGSLSQVGRLDRQSPGCDTSARKIMRAAPTSGRVGSGGMAV